MVGTEYRQNRGGEKGSRYVGETGRFWPTAAFADRRFSAQSGSSWSGSNHPMMHMRYRHALLSISGLRNRMSSLTLAGARQQGLNF